MKKCMSLFLAMVLCVSLLPSALAGEQMLVITPGGWLNLRKGPSTRDEVKQYIPNGDRVTVWEHLENGWTEVTWKNTTGYVQTEFLGSWHDYLLKQYPDAQKAYPSGSNTHVRKGKDSLSPVLLTVDKYAEFTVLETDGIWSRVSLEDEKGNCYEGYVLSNSLEIRDEPVSESSMELKEEMFIWEAGVMKSEQPMYADPDPGSTALRNVPAGTKVLVETVQFPWCMIRIGAYIGWVMMEDVQLTGESETNWYDDMRYDYVAHHHTAKSVDGTLEFYIYPRSELDMVAKTVAWDTEKPLIVLQANHKQYGQSWTKVWDGGEVSGWVLSSQLDIGTAFEQYEYEHNVPAFTTGIAYAGPGGARLYKDGSELSEIKLTIPAGTELLVSFNPRGYAHVTYRQEDGTEIMGYAPYEDLLLGFADQTDKDYDKRQEDTREEMPLADLIAETERALGAQYPDFDAEKLTRTETYGKSPSGDLKFYDIAYFEGENYRFAVRIHAVTGAVLRAVCYDGFHDDPDDGYITRTEALENAVQALKKKDKAFAPDAFTMTWDYSPGGDKYEFKFLDEKGEVHYAASVHLENGKVSGARAVKKDEEQRKKASQNQMSDSKAKAIGEEALAGAYAAFDAQTLTLVTEKVYKDGVSRMEMAYFDGTGKYVYTVHVNLVNGEIIFMADYSQGDHTVTQRTPKPTDPTPAPDEADIGKAAARAIADNALRGKFADFDPASFSVIHETRKLVMPGIGGPLYQFDYHTEDNSRYACCMVDAATGDVLYTSNKYNSDLTEIDYDPTPAPTPRPVGTDMGESAARQKADAALENAYPEFDIAGIDWVRCKYYGLDEEDGTSWDKPYYQFDYFIEDGDSPYCAVVHAYTGEILYLFGSLPGEGNG
ncbi:MAG: hypothetical protein E7326_00335 [Clostridiales bacterium]|nr:hypothetical protein [Clostridiales bacterium]